MGDKVLTPPPLPQNFTQHQKPRPKLRLLVWAGFAVILVAAVLMYRWGDHINQIATNRPSITNPPPNNTFPTTTINMQNAKPMDQTKNPKLLTLSYSRPGSVAADNQGRLPVMAVTYTLSDEGTLTRSDNPSFSQQLDPEKFQQVEDIISSLWNEPTSVTAGQPRPDSEILTVGIYAAGQEKLFYSADIPTEAKQLETLIFE